MASNSTQPVYTAKLGLVTISTPNSNLDGSGTVGTIILGAANGTLVKSLIIKAQTDTTQGMIRLFVKNAGGSNLVQEINVPPIIKSGRDLSFYTVIPINYTLKSGEAMKASTEYGDTFNIIAEAFDISYLATSIYLGTSTEFTANAGSDVISVANPNLDGTGTLVKIITAGTAASGFLGCAISSVRIKGISTSSPGMIRLYAYDPTGGNYFLFCEVLVPSVVQSATTQSFAAQAIGGSFCIPAGYEIWASTENAEPFSISVEGSDWKSV